MAVAESLSYFPHYTRGNAPVIDENFGKGLKTIGGQEYLFEMLVIPVDFDSYLDILRKI